MRSRAHGAHGNFRWRGDVATCCMYPLAWLEGCSSSSRWHPAPSLTSNTFSPAMPFRSGGSPIINAQEGNGSWSCHTVWQQRRHLPTPRMTRRAEMRAELNLLEEIAQCPYPEVAACTDMPLMPSSQPPCSCCTAPHPSLHLRCRLWPSFPELPQLGVWAAAALRCGNGALHTTLTTALR